MDTPSIGSVQEFLESVQLVQTESPEVVYRGEAKLFPKPCCPGLFRDHPSGSNLAGLFGYKNEREKVYNWHKRVMEAEGRYLHVQNDLERLILAQHYGVKTRLLDWSTNPLVALWMASSAENDNDGIIYTSEQDNLDLYGELNFKPDDAGSDRYNALAINPFCLERPAHYYKTADVLNPYKEAHFFRPAYLPDNRVLAQKALISIHPNPVDTHESVGVAHASIIASKKMYILRELDVLGISHRTLGLATRESIARDING